MLPQLLLQPAPKLQSQFYRVSVGNAHPTSYLAELKGFRKRFGDFDVKSTRARPRSHPTWILPEIALLRA
jgi:hypothetical protein